jgi:hypothetical protein
MAHRQSVSKTCAGRHALLHCDAIHGYARRLADDGANAVRLASKARFGMHRATYRTFRTGYMKMYTNPGLEPGSMGEPLYLFTTG